MTAPTVNLNGNTRESLVEQAMAVHRELKQAMKLVADSDLSHGRNFQTDPANWHKACSERLETYDTLKRISDEYLNLAIAINEQGR